MKKYKLYLFDFDGTLFDTSLGLYYVFKEAFKVAGVEIEESDVTYLSRVPLSQSFEEYKCDPSKAKEFVDRIENALDEDEAIYSTKKYAEIDEFLDYTKKNSIRLGVVTSNNVSHVYKILDYLKIDRDAFEVYVGSDKCKFIKPRPEPILMALSELNYQGKKEDVVYVGDSFNDCLSAKNAGISYYLLDRKNNSNYDFPKINNLMELFK